MSRMVILCVLVGMAFLGFAAPAQAQSESRVERTERLDSRDYELVVESAHGTPTPPVGTHVYAWNAVVTCRVQRVVSVGGIEYTCTGWTGTGSMPESGTTTNTGEVTLDSIYSTIRWEWESDLQIVEPNVHTNLLAGRLAGGHTVPAISFDYEVSGSSYIEFEVDTQSTSSGVAPAGLSNMDLNIWRVYFMESGKPMLDTSTKIRPRQEGVWLLDRDWGVDQWRGARYRWKLYRIGSQGAADQQLASGSFSLACLGISAGASINNDPVVLLHGIGGRRNKWEIVPHFVNSLGAQRPVYVLEYPNTDDIAVSAHLLGLALQRISTAHANRRVHGVVHSMGGVVAQYYKQRLSSGMGNKMHRLVTIGSPLQGSAFAESASARGWKDAMILSLVAGASSLTTHELADLLGTANTPAMHQLANPQTELGLLRNDDASVKTDDWLAACGTQMGLFFGKAVVDAILEDSLASIVLKNALSFETQHAIQGSDGVVSWYSANKWPLSQNLNLYYDANHNNYFDGVAKNKDYNTMISDINGYLAHGMPAVSSRLTHNPPVLLEQTVVDVFEAGKSLGVAVCYTYLNKPAGIIKLLGGIVGEGKMTVTSAFVDRFSDTRRASRSESADNAIYVYAPGYEEKAIGYVAEDGSPVITETQVEMQPDPTWNRPRNPSLRINNGALSTASATVQLTVYADNATQVAIHEPEQEPSNWQAYAGGEASLSYTFASPTLGEKTVVAAFRNPHGTGPSATENITLVQSGQTGSILVQDDAGGGAYIYLNGRLINEITPATVAGLPTGTHVISIYKDNTPWNETVKSVDVMSGQTTVIEFAAASTAPSFTDLRKASGQIEFSWAGGRRSGGRYRMMYSTNLADGWVPLSSEIIEGGSVQNYSHILPDAHSAFFMLEQVGETNATPTPMPTPAPTPTPAPAGSLYMVIDLSGGTNASSYPVSYLTAVPGGSWSEEYKTTKLVMRRIQADTFTMGSPTNELGREPWDLGSEAQRTVTLTRDFYIGVFQVTQKQWEMVMGDRPSYFSNTTYYPKNVGC